MKKILVIAFLGILINSSAIAFSAKGYLKDYVYPGMTKKELIKFTEIGWKASWPLYRTHEIKNLGGINISTAAFCSHEYKGKKWDNQHVYFSEYKTEIFTHIPNMKNYGGKLDNWPWYVFENVSNPIKCKERPVAKDMVPKPIKSTDGTLKAVVWSKEEALLIADPSYAKKIEDEKRRKEEEKRIADKKKKDSREAVDLAATLYYWGLSTDKLSMYFYGGRDRNNLKGHMTITDENYLPWHGIFGISAKDYEKFDITVKTKSGTSLEFIGKNKKKQKVKLNFNNKSAVLLDSEGNKSSLKLKKPEKLFAAKTFDADKPDKKKPKIQSPDDGSIIAAASGTGFFVSRTGHVITNYHVKKK